MPIHGNSTAGTGNAFLGGNNKGGTLFPNFPGGTITDFYIYMNSDFAVGEKLKGVVYLKTDGIDAATLQLTTSEVEGEGTVKWYAWTGLSVAVGAGALLLGAIVDNNVSIRYGWDASLYFYNNTDAYSDGPSNPFAAANSQAGPKCCVYVVYTTGDGATYTKTWTTDVLFKKLGITKTALVDVAFKKPDVTKAFGLDVALKKKDIQLQKQVDVLFKKLDILKTFGADVDFLKKDIVKSFAVDARFGAVVTHTISKQIDVLFEKLGVTRTFGIDAYFGAVGAVAYTKNFALDVVFAYKVRLPEIWLDEEGKIVLNISRPYVWVGS